MGKGVVCAVIGLLLAITAVTTGASTVHADTPTPAPAAPPVLGACPDPAWNSDQKDVFDHLDPSLQKGLCATPPDKRNEFLTASACVRNGIAMGVGAAFSGNCWQNAGNAIAAGGSALANGALAQATKWMADGASKGTTMLIDTIQNPSLRPQINASWFDQQYYGSVKSQYGGSGTVPVGPNGARIVGTVEIGAILMVVFLFLAIIAGIVRGDPVGILKAVMVRLPVAVAFTLLVGVLASWLLDLDDTTSRWLLAPTAGHLGDFQTQVAQSTSGGWDAVVFLTSLVMLLSTLMGAAELVLRDAALYLVILIAPLVAATSIWPQANGAIKKVLEALVVLCFAKSMMALVLSTGLSIIGSTGHSISSLVVSAVIFFMAATAPLFFFRLMPALEGAIAGGAAGYMAGRGAGALQRHGTSMASRTASAGSAAALRTGARGAGGTMHLAGNGIRLAGAGAVAVGGATAGAVGNWRKKGAAAKVDSSSTASPQGSTTTPPRRPAATAGQGAASPPPPPPPPPPAAIPRPTRPTGGRPNG